MNPDLLTTLRHDTPGTQHVAHFNNAGAALMPKPVLDAITQHLHLEATIGGYEAAERAADDIQGFYTATAELLNTRPGNVAATASATDAYGRALSAVPFQPGDVLLTTQHDYVSNQIQFLSLQKRFGIRVVRAADDPAGGVSVADMAEKIEQLRPRLVAVTHVPTNTGLVQPVDEIGQHCRRFGVWYLVDACQSVGQLPVDVTTLNCDFLSATWRKFLRGPRGLGFLYVSDRALNAGLEPLFIDLRGANWVAPDQYVPQPDAQRFEDWEFPHALLLGAAEAARYALRLGLPAIAERNAHLCALLRSKLAQLPGLRLLDEGEHLSSIITLTLADQPADQLKLRLRAQGLNVSVLTRGSAVFDFDRKNVSLALRVSPHYYNTEEEIERLVAGLGQRA